MPKVLVTGGGGFVGKALGAALVKLGYQVISVSRGNYPELGELGIKHIRLDLSKDLSALTEAAEGAEAVFHTAAKVDMWGRYRDFFEANVVATRNVIGACRNNGIRKLIFTSSPSVVADGKDLLGVDESYPYPKRYTAYYPRTKAMAEREVLAANSKELGTIALRPHLIWGRGDTNLIPTVVGKAKAGKLLRIGDGTNRTDLTYIDDCVAAHLLADRAISDNPGAAGRAYFISQGDPVSLWGWVDEILSLHGLGPITRSVSKKVAMGAATILEVISKLTPGSPEPLFTRFLVSEMATSHYFDISAAKKELGYTPRFTIKEAMKDCFGVTV